jgi:hypothetical protein
MPWVRLEKNHGGGFVKDKAKKILANSEVGVSEDLPTWIRNSFLIRRTHLRLECIVVNGRLFLNIF